MQLEIKIITILVIGQIGFFRYIPTLAQSFGGGVFTQQIVDHFDPSNTAVFNQTYRYNKTCYKTGGPIFLFIEFRYDFSQGDIKDLSGNQEAHIADMICDF